MDVLSSELIWIDGRCYRVKESNHRDTTGPDVQELYDVDDTDGYNDEDEEDFDLQIEHMQNGKSRISFHVPQLFFGQIIGSKGSIRKRLENETRTQIKIPNIGVGGDIIITGATDKAVIKAKRRIDLIVMAARKKQPFTHFLSIQITSPEIKERFRDLKKQILDAQMPRIDESLFQLENKLHLTIGIMSLVDNEDRAKAARVLQECKEQVIKPILQQYGELSVEMSGLEYMNDDPSDIHILYGKVHEGDNWSQQGALQILADNIVEYFVKKGVMRKEREKVTLHVTLLNSTFASTAAAEGEVIPPRISFDAREIFKLFGNYQFGKQKLDKIQLSQRHTVTPEGYYQSTSSVECSI